MNISRDILIQNVADAMFSARPSMQRKKKKMEVAVADRASSRSFVALNDMPSEILINICAYLDYKDLVRCSRINRRLRDVCAHDAHWKRLCNKYWLETELPEDTTWKLHFFSLYRHLRRYAHCYAQIKSAWQKIQHFMKENCPVIFQSIREGTSEERLDEAERKLGVRLPDDLRCSYRIHNGQRLASPGLMGSMSIPSHYRSEFMLDIETAVTGFQVLRSREGLEGCMPLTFCLHSGQSQLIALRDTDGHVPFTVFYPSHDPVDYFITGRSFSEWFTTYGEMLHRKEFVVLDSQPYRFYHEPGCEQVTGHTRVKVATCFVPELSTINPPHFFHTYRITMSMSEEAPEQDSCQLETRHWIITDENGKEERVDGRGEYPVMYPGAEFSWISCANLPTTYGNMKGHFVMRNLQTGDRIEVQCPVFHMKCLPYVTSAEREALKREKHALKKAQ
ncbi:F-box only protein 3-like isoform X3 [Ornithodoros turicata]|uniref:F-box only protein 3-like isoform X3 n=1 Tax=Ornithodoros turicata TaxID=34597 RepID=UPI003139668A